MIEVYMLSNIETSKSYVGLTSRKAYGNGILISNAKKKYGRSAFVPVILARTESKQEADKLERFYISLFCTLHPNGYNLALGGEGGAIQTAEMKAQLSKTLRQGYKDNPERANKISESLKGRVSPNKGRKLADEVKQKISKAVKSAQYTHSAEHKERMRILMTGRKFSKETLLKMSKSAKERANTKEGRAQMLKASLLAKGGH